MAAFHGTTSPALTWSKFGNSKAVSPSAVTRHRPTYGRPSRGSASDSHVHAHRRAASGSRRLSSSCFDLDQRVASSLRQAWLQQHNGEWRCKVSDFCLSRPMLDRVFRQAELMDRVMAHVGVNPAVAARVDKGVAFYEARTKCISCCHERECRNWLQSGTREPRPAHFCPNAAFLRTCATRSR